MGNGERGYRVKRNIPIRQTLNDLAVELTIFTLFRFREQLKPCGISNFQSVIRQEAFRICSCCLKNNNRFRLLSILFQKAERAKAQRVLGLPSYYGSPRAAQHLSNNAILGTHSSCFNPYLEFLRPSTLRTPWLHKCQWVKNIHAAPSIWRLCP